jgi:hypothetical protein
MDSVPSRRRARLVLLPDSAPSLSSVPPAPSEAPGDGDGDEDPPSPELERPPLDLSRAAPSALLQFGTKGEPISAKPGAPIDRFPESTPDLSEGLGQGLGWIGGVTIALVTVVVPLTSVVLDRENHPSSLRLPRLPQSSQDHGSHNPSGLSSPGVRESPGGDSGRKSQ